LIGSLFGTTAITITSIAALKADFAQRAVKGYDPMGYGAKGDGVADDTAALLAIIDASFAVGGGTVYLQAGTYRITSTINLKQGVNLVGQGEKSIIYRDFVGGTPAVNYPGGVPVILRDFKVARNLSLTPVLGDDGIKIGYDVDWIGRGEVKNLFITGQYDGFTWKWGSFNIFDGIVCDRNERHGFTGRNARGSLLNCLASDNKGCSYFVYSDSGGDSGLSFDGCGTFANQLYGYCFDAINGSVWTGNFYFNNSTSSTDGAGGMIFQKQVRQVHMMQMFVETAGGARSVFPGFTAFPNARGIDFAGDVVGATLTNVQVKNCNGRGFEITGGGEMVITNIYVAGNRRVVSSQGYRLLELYFRLSLQVS
jgi:hypothetical protein